MRTAQALVCLFSLIVAPLYCAATEGDAPRGQTLYESRCVACHSLDASRVGPAHRGVYGRKAGSVADYAYSDALKNSQIVWNATTLDQWLTDPEKLIPGQKMNYNVPDAQDRADVIAYLKQESGK